MPYSFFSGLPWLQFLFQVLHSVLTLVRCNQLKDTIRADEA